MSKWYTRHVNDPWVRQAQRDGFRSRAVYKLQEMDEREKLVMRGATVVDLGAAPGGWSQYCAPRVGRKGRVVALDLLPMEPLSEVDFLQGDFTEEAVLRRLLAVIDGRADLVLSDLAPNISGIKSVDLPRAMYLAELAADCARKVLKPGGSFVTKLFHGEGFDDYVKSIRSNFDIVKVRKPKASRPKSRETYLVARNYRL